MSSVKSSPRPALLIVEDDPDVLSALAFVADARGFDVACCRSTGEAMALAVPGRCFACLIIDQMLDGDRGIDLLANLRSRGIEAPAILVTTAPSPTLKRRAAAAGAPIVEKPLLDEILFTQIDRLMRAD